MLLTVTLNPSIDRSYYVEGFNKNGVYRTKYEKITSGGKGLNVSRVLKKLDMDVIATGFLGGKSGEYIKDELDRLSIINDFVNIDGETRNCIAILSDDESHTEILEKGPVITEEYFYLFLKKFESILEQHLDIRFVSVSGSIPQGLKDDIYKRLIMYSNKFDIKIILDSSGEYLKNGIEAKPFLIKPNLDEINSLLNKNLNQKNFIEEIENLELENIIISLGEDGAIAKLKNNFYRVMIPKVKVINPVGSGDSMIAGFMIGYEKDYDDIRLLKFATACGMSNAITKTTGDIDLIFLKDIINEIEIKKI
ncbi:MAG: tagatose 6-phosphate kinase [Oceanotoga sp.]|uniref:1-phosphofructokinase family hexose kinase n=1 Tax=Oceanotoga sp. TaxID=2108366 RepID=UPI002654144E|nr:1-phosphofructokinase family hexose kinase [Oceanotoga sp.]MDN5342241.1 tagatose 6-phosphate kinase [Oceanotoga sp.]